MVDRARPRDEQKATREKMFVVGLPAYSALRETVHMLSELESGYYAQVACSPLPGLNGTTFEQLRELSPSLSLSLSLSAVCKGRSRGDGVARLLKITTTSPEEGLSECSYVHGRVW